MIASNDADPLLQKHNPPYTFWVSVLFLILLGIGLANLYSASLGTHYFNSQMKHTALGLFSFALFGWVIPIRYVNTYSYLFFGFICVSLLIVLALGHSAGGAQRWIILGPMRFQPSEVAKIAIVMMVAKFFYNNKSKSAYTIRDLAPVLGGASLIFALIFKQPDFGTAGICLIIVFAQLVFVRIQIGFKAVLSIVLINAVSAVVGWFFLLREYQKLRILNLLNPNLDPSGSGYNSLQSLVAIGSGGQFGKGFLDGTQTQLQFLPARHTDFIFSVFAEEHGFWGGALVFLLFALIAYLALEIAHNAKDSFGSLLSIGMGALIFIEFTINVAMVLGIFPVVGMPLPFFSYGGSSMLTICLAMGLLVAVDRDRVRAQHRSKFQGLG